MVDILCKDNCCYGVVARDAEDKIFPIEANYTMLACGGIGGIYRHSTNFRHLTGDAVAIALKHGIETEHVNYVQIHLFANLDRQQISRKKFIYKPLMILVIEKRALATN